MKISEWAKARGVRLFHFTSCENLPGIRKYGLLSWASAVKQKLVIPRPGGDKASHRLDRIRDTLDYVHMCFVDQHQMEHKLRTTGRVPNAIFLPVALAVLDGQGVWFSDRNATDTDARFGQGLEWFQTYIDWKLIVDRKCDSTPANFRRRPPMFSPVKEKWQAEVLVPKVIDPIHIAFPD